MKPISLPLPILLWVLALAMVPAARAGALYRCEAGDGGISYGSRLEPSKDCRQVASYATPPAGSANEFHTAPPGRKPAAPAGGQVSRGAVYKYERDGITHYTNVRPARDADAKVLFTYVETCYACAARPGVDFHTVALNTAAYREEVRRAAREFGVEEALLRAVMHAESAFDPMARSHKGAQGLMQLMPATAARFGVADPYAPEQNIRGGAEYLSWLLGRYQGDRTLAAAAYNAGEAAVDRSGGVPAYEETRRYVERVGILADRYRTRLAAAP